MALRAALVAAWVALLLGCSSGETSRPPRTTSTPGTTSGRPSTPASAPALPVAPPAALPQSTDDSTGSPVAPPPLDLGAALPLPAPERIETALTIASGQGAIGERLDDPVTIRRRIEMRWSSVADVRDVALELWDQHHVVVGLEPDQWMDGGFRGRLHLVPEIPTGPHVRHLGWLRDAHATIDRVLTTAEERSPAASPIRFRHQGIVVGFFRSVGRTTPSAYASSWRIGYNVSGSLLGTREGVLETLFHEIVHLNDEGDPWSEAHLRAIHDAIVARCGARTACLRPYAPTKTLVRGGTYYAFQPDNGDAVHEYAAEVATRWFLEHRAIVDGAPAPFPTAFKCGPEENARAWRAVADGFFGGIDLVPPCPTGR